MPSNLLKLLMLSAAIGMAATNVARADCESDLLELEAAYKTPSLGVVAKTALDEAKTVAVAALKKDDGTKCHAAITGALTKAGIKAAAAAPAAPDAPATSAVPAAAPPAAAAPVIAANALGDLSAYKTIAEDTLKIVNTNDLKAARTRIRNLELAWDKAEATMRPRDEDAWLTLDVSIDEALAALRTPNPDKAECAKVLQTLIADFDSAAKKS